MDGSHDFASELFVSLYVSEKETAQLLGRSLTWFKNNRDKLELSYGLPKLDRALNLRNRESLIEWARKRNRNIAKIENSPASNKENYDGF